MMKTARHLTAGEAAKALGITPATLYAYVSRGQLRSEPTPGRPKARRYYREDLERLLERKEARRDPAKAVARGLHWGGPVLESGITLIDNGRFYYRGHDAVALAETASLEHAAGLLWAADETERERLFEQPCALSARQLAQLRACAKDPFTLLQAALPMAASIDLASYDLRPAAVRQTGARIIRLLTTLIAPRHANAPVHWTLQTVWTPKTDMFADVIRTALVLGADHELTSLRLWRGARRRPARRRTMSYPPPWQRSRATSTEARPSACWRCSPRPRHRNVPEIRSQAGSAVERRCQHSAIPSTPQAIHARLYCCGWPSPAETRRTGACWAIGTSA